MLLSNFGNMYYLNMVTLDLTLLSKISHILIIKNPLVVSDGIFLYPCY